MALNIPDIQPIRAMNITKNRTNVHGAFDRRSQWCYLFVLLLLRVATFLPVAYIFIQGTLESKLDEISYKFQGLSSTDCNFKDFQGLEFLF